MKSFFSALICTCCLMHVQAQNYNLSDWSFGTHYSFANHQEIENTIYHGIGGNFSNHSMGNFSSVVTAEFFIPKTRHIRVPYNDINGDIKYEEGSYTTALAHISAGLRFYIFGGNETLNGRLQGISLEVSGGMGLKYNQFESDDNSSNSYWISIIQNQPIQPVLIYGLTLGYELNLNQYIPYIQLSHRASLENNSEAMAGDQSLIQFNKLIQINLGVRIPLG